MTFIIFVALIGLAISGSAFLAYQLMLNFRPGPTRMKKEVEKLLSSFKDVIPELVPIDVKELELFSHSHIRQESRGGISKTAKGIIVSIYEEPLVAYAYKRYSGKKENALLIARTANATFFFRIRNQQVQVSLNDQAIGIIERNGILYSPGNFQPMAKIEKKEKTESFPITVEGKEVAILIPEDTSLKVHQRALQFVGNLNKREELLLLVMLTWDLVRAKTE
jgi:hypothetical protein